MVKTPTEIHRVDDEGINSLHLLCEFLVSLTVWFTAKKRNGEKKISWLLKIL